MKLIKKILWIIAVILIVFGLISVIQFFSKNGQIFNRDHSSVITEIRSMNRLETASFTIEKIIEAGSDHGVIKNILYGDKILLVAHAEIIAGFDFSKILDSDIKIDGGKIEIKMPAAEILVVDLDNEKTRVYDRKLGIFTKGDPSLESQSRLVAEELIRQAACEGDILGIAGENGEKQMTYLLKSFGFESVEIEIQKVNCI